MLLALPSVIINLTVYIIFLRWLVDNAAAELEAPDIFEEAQHHLAFNLLVLGGQCTC
jgi:hypothetical protein